MRRIRFGKRAPSTPKASKEVSLLSLGSLSEKVGRLDGVPVHRLIGQEEEAGAGRLAVNLFVVSFKRLPVKPSPLTFFDLCGTLSLLSETQLGTRRPLFSCFQEPEGAVSGILVSDMSVGYIVSSLSRE